VTPSHLIAEFRRIVADETGCQASWEEHPQALRADEIARIQWRIVDLFNRLATENRSSTAKYPPHSSSVESRNRAVRFKPLPTNPAMFHHIL
jgi:hypothetical protein